MQQNVRTLLLPSLKNLGQPLRPILLSTHAISDAFQRGLFLPVLPNHDFRPRADLRKPTRPHFLVRCDLVHPSNNHTELRSVTDYLERPFQPRIANRVVQPAGYLEPGPSPFRKYEFWHHVVQLYLGDSGTVIRNVAHTCGDVGGDVWRQLLGSGVVC